MSSPVRIWLPELLALGGSAAFMGLIVGLLFYFDGREIFDLDDLGISLNAIVSLLATTTKSLLAISVSEAVSQWAWLVFSDSSRPRPLVDLERIDQASRGSMGSVALLAKYRGPGFWLRFGAVITFLSMIFDPMAQLLVQLDHALVADVNSAQPATVPRATRYDQGFRREMDIILSPYSSGPDSANVFASANFALESAILSGLSSDKRHTAQQLKAQCPSGNCTWTNAYDSLAVCSRCEDVSSDLTSFPQGQHVSLRLFLDQNRHSAGMDMIYDGTAFQLPNGHFITNQNADATLAQSNPNTMMLSTYGTGNPSRTNKFKDMDTLIWSMSLLRHNDTAVEKWPDVPVEALECALYYCVNRYETRIEDGRIEEKTTQFKEAKRMMDSWAWSDEGGFLKASAPKNHTGPLLTPAQAESLEFDPLFSFVARTDLSLVIEGKRQFNLSQNAVDSVSAFFKAKFWYNATMADDGETFRFLKPLLTGGDGEVPELPRETGLLNGFYLASEGAAGAGTWQPNHVQPLHETRDLRDTFASVALAMSNAIRHGDDDGQTVEGTVFRNVVIYEVAWAWLTPHVVLIIGAGLLLFATMHRQEAIQQRRGHAVPAWKSSVLGMLSRGPVVADAFAGTWTGNGAASHKHMIMRARRAQAVLGPDGFEKQGLDTAAVPLVEQSVDGDMPLEPISTLGGQAVKGPSHHVGSFERI